MKDFNKFLKQISENTDAITNSITNNLPDVSESQRTISKEEWGIYRKSYY